MNTKIRNKVQVSFFILILMLTTPVWAASPFINYQGELTDSNGMPVNGQVTIIFSIWDDPVETDKATYLVWEEMQLVSVTDGVFTAQLGSSTPLPAPYEFNSSNLYLEINVGGTVYGPRTLLNTTPASFWAEQSGNAVTLDGHYATDFAAANHTHSFAEITNSTEYIDSRIAELQAKIDAQQEQIDLLLQALTPEELSGLSTEFTQLSTRIDTLETTSQNRAALDDLLPFVSVTGSNIIISGANLNIQNGSGTTTTANGTGNLIIGYNLPSAEGGARTGSHNLIIGDSHSYSSYAGIAAGEQNSILAPFASIVGGGFSTILGDHGAILGGYGNTVKSIHGTIVGGSNNIVTTDSAGASILGGDENKTFGSLTSIAGGSQNQAVGDASSILGGEENISSGETSAILGGYKNSTAADRGVVLGGSHETFLEGQEIGPLVTSFDEVMTLTNDTLRITGVNVQIVNGAGTTNSTNGKGNLILGYNEEPLPDRIEGGRTGSHNIIIGNFNNYDATSGIAVGYYNYLGSSGVAFGIANSITAPADSEFPGIATVVGGAVNHASGFLSSIIGGRENEASGEASAIVGGRDNIASGERSTIGGGDKNEAGGVDATVGGGLQNRAFLEKSAIPAGRYRSEEGL